MNIHDHRQKYYTVMNIKISNQENHQIFVYFNSTPLTFTKKMLKLKY